MTMLNDRRTLPNVRYYRTPSLLSPDGQYAAYSRIQMTLAPDYTSCKVASVLFLENLEMGSLQTITADSPMSGNPFMPSTRTDETEQVGTIAILIPVGWSEAGDRLLAREFESVFGSSLASDYGVVWHRPENLVYTIAPTRVTYSNAVVLGWSQVNPHQVLFRAGMMGSEPWEMYRVDLLGGTQPVVSDRPMVYGNRVDSLWSGPQAAAS
jgi:hypothetical protein